MSGKTPAKGIREKSKKRVFKQVLVSPFTYKWKYLEPEMEKLVISQLEKFAQSLAVSRDTDRARFGIPLKQLSDERKLSTKEERKSMPGAKDSMMHDQRDICIGINQVTRLLESQLARKCAGVDTTKSSEDSNETLLVFICLEDLPSIGPVEHLPVLAYQVGGVCVCPLRKGSESTLSKAFGLKRLSTFAILQSSSGEHLKDVRDLVEGALEHVKLGFPLNLKAPTYTKAVIEQVDVTPKEPKSKKHKKKH